MLACPAEVYMSFWIEETSVLDNINNMCTIASNYKLSLNLEILLK